MLKRWVSTNWATKIVFLFTTFAVSSNANTIYFKFTVGDILTAATAAGIPTGNAGLYDFWAAPSISGNGSTPTGFLPNGAALSSTGNQSPVPQASFPSDYYLVTVPDANGFKGTNNWAHFYIQQSNDLTGDPAHTAALFATTYNNGASLLRNKTFLTTDAVAPLHSMAGGVLALNDYFLIAVDSGATYVAPGTVINWTWTVAALTWDANGNQTGGQKPLHTDLSMTAGALAPEPGTLSMLFAGGFLLVLGLRRKRT